MPDDIGLIVKQMRAGRRHAADRRRRRLRHAAPRQVGGPAANDVYFSTHAYMAPRTPPTAIKKFYTDYKAAYGTDPENAFAALGYDTVGLIADAIKRAGAEGSAAVKTRSPRPTTSRHHRHDHLRPRESRPAEGRDHHRRQGGALTLGGEVVPEKVPAP